MNGKLYEGDARKHLHRFSLMEKQFDGCVTDPPYFIESIQKRFGKKSSAAQQAGRDGRYKRAADSFHGSTSWDAPGEDGDMISRDPAFWALVLDCLKPGAFCLAFSDARYGHHQAMAMEQAGFIMHPMIPWVNTQGFPKAHAVSRTASKAGYDKAAKKWRGWYGGGQALNPCVEPIHVAQKPMAMPMYLNQIEYGVGAFNIDACRVPLLDEEKADNKLPVGGRWPGNFAHDASDGVRQFFPDKIEHRFPAFAYKGKPNAAERRSAGAHPTVKPVELLRWLCRLIAPRGAHILDPFAGSGTTGAAAAFEGMSCTLIERETAYIETIRARLDLPPAPKSRRKARPNLGV